jgi:hypothetical protein
MKWQVILAPPPHPSQKSLTGKKYFKAHAKAHTTQTLGFVFEVLNRRVNLTAKDTFPYFYFCSRAYACLIQMH